MRIVLFVVGKSHASVAMYVTCCQQPMYRYNQQSIIAKAYTSRVSESAARSDVQPRAVRAGNLLGAAVGRRTRTQTRHNDDDSLLEQAANRHNM